jgi:hypothetical protein
MTSDEILIEELRAEWLKSNVVFKRAADRIQNLLARNSSIELAYRMSEEELKAARRVVLSLQEALERANANSAVFNMKHESPHKHWPCPGEMDCYECVFDKDDAAPQPAQPLKDREQIAADILNEAFKDTDEEAHPTPADFVRAGYTADGQPTHVPRGTSKDRPLDRPAIAYPPTSGSAQNEQYGPTYTSELGWHLGRRYPSADPAIDTAKYLTGRDTWFIKE